MSAISTTRRTFLGGAALAGATAATGAGIAIAAEPARTANIVENPDLLEAHGRLMAALSEREEAKSALQWIADEWRHLWPLAPEELLGCANADRCGGSPEDGAERDIIGNYIKRDASILTVRLSKRFRQSKETFCFAVMTEREALEIAERWTTSTPKGRTPKSLQNAIALRDRVIHESKHKAALARDYEQDTERLREAAGVANAHRRIMRAKASVEAVCEEISLMPAQTQEGFRIKAEAIKSSGIFAPALNCGGVFAEMARFIEDVARFDGRASA